MPSHPHLVAERDIYLGIVLIPYAKCVLIAIIFPVRNIFYYTKVHVVTEIVSTCFYEFLVVENLPTCVRYQIKSISKRANLGSKILCSPLFAQIAAFFAKFSAYRNISHCTMFAWVYGEAKP